MRPATLSIALLAIVTGACEGPAHTGQLDVEDLQSLVPVEDLRIGSAEDPDLGFSRISAVDVDRDGQIYVLESLDMQIRVYGSAGQPLRRIGRRGEGPGEFESVHRFGVLGDTVWVVEPQGAGLVTRITLFNREGEVLSTGRAEGLEIPFSDRTGILIPRHMRSDGHLVTSFYAHRFDREGRDEALDTAAVPRVLFDATGAVVDTIGWDPHPSPNRVPPPGRRGPELRRIQIRGREVLVPPAPFDWPEWFPLADGQVVLDTPYADTAQPSTFTVTRIGLSGDTVYHRTFNYRPAAYTSADLDSIASRNARLGGGAIYYPDGRIDPPPDEVEAIAGAMRAAMDFPEFRLPVHDGWLSNEGALWLLRESDVGSPTSRWIVLDVEGMPRGELELPSSVRPLWARGDTLWASVPDELDVPWLVRYRLQGS